MKAPNHMTFQSRCCCYEEEINKTGSRCWLRHIIQTAISFPSQGKWQNKLVVYKHNSGDRAVAACLSMEQLESEQLLSAHSRCLGLKCLRVEGEQHTELNEITWPSPTDTKPVWIEIMMKHQITDVTAGSRRRLVHTSLVLCWTRTTPNPLDELSKLNFLHWCWNSNVSSGGETTTWHHSVAV